MNQLITKRLMRLGLSIVSVFGLSSLAAPPAKAQTASATALCTGTPTADVPVDVTKLMSQVASGVKVYQLTGLDKNGNLIKDAGGKVIPNYITNVDVQNYTALNPPSFVVNTDNVFAKTIRVDHSGAQVAGTLRGLHVRVSIDGNLIAQAGMRVQDNSGKPGEADIFVTNLAAPGACQSAWATNQHFTPATSSGASGIPVTNPSWDASAGKYLIAYAPGGGNSPLPPAMYSVYSDGSSSHYTPMEPVDTCKGFLYHKVRMDYRWPNLVFLQREDAIGQHVCGDIMDLSTGHTIQYGDGTGGRDSSKWQIYYNHDDQAPDGQHFLMEATLATGGMAFVKLLDDQGNFIPGSNSPNPIPASNGNKAIANPSGYELLNPATSKVQTEWCDLQPNNKALCTSGGANSTGGPGLGTGIPTGCYPAYTIDTTTLALKFVACTDSHKTQVYEGLGAIRFSYTSADGNYHAIFRSDKTGTPQVYEVVYKP